MTLLVGGFQVNDRRDPQWRPRQRPVLGLLGFMSDREPDILTFYVEIEPHEHVPLLNLDLIIFDFARVLADSKSVINRAQARCSKSLALDGA